MELDFGESTLPGRLLGRDIKIDMDSGKLKTTNILTIGAAGTGKTEVIKDRIEQLKSEDDIGVIVVTNSIDKYKNGLHNIDMLVSLEDNSNTFIDKPNKNSKYKTTWLFIDGLAYSPKYLDMIAKLLRNANKFNISVNIICRNTMRLTYSMIDNFGLVEVFRLSELDIHDMNMAKQLGFGKDSVFKEVQSLNNYNNILIADTHRIKVKHNI